MLWFQGEKKVKYCLNSKLMNSTQIVLFTEGVLNTPGVLMRPHVCIWTPVLLPYLIALTYGKITSHMAYWITDYLPRRSPVSSRLFE